jgi:CHASE2 domain-containing sensor protein
VTKGVGVSEIVAMVLMTFAVQWLGYHGWLASAEGKVVDWLLQPGNTPPGDVVVVEIDNQAYEHCFKSTSPLNPEMVSKIATAFHEAKPLAIGFDILTESDKYRDIPKDIVWIGGFEDPKPMHEIGYIEWLFGRTEELEGIPLPVLGQKRPGSVTWGMPAMLLDEDRKVRRIARKFWLMEVGDLYPVGSQAHFATAVANSYCTSTRPHTPCHVRSEGSDTYIRYSKTPKRISLEKIWSCDTNDHTELWPFFEQEVANKVVLVGGTYKAARDDYATPLGDLPGVLVNAYAIQSEIDGDVLRDVYRPVAFLTELMIGFVVVLLSARLKDSRWFPVLVALVFLLASWGITRYLGSQYLPGLIGAILGVLTETFLHPVHKLFEKLGKFSWIR